MRRPPSPSRAGSPGPWGRLLSTLGSRPPEGDDDPAEWLAGAPPWAQNFYFEHRDVLGHLVFRPVLSLHTPLHVLEHDGREFDGPPELAPRVAREEHGIWCPRLALWRRAGIEPPRLAPEPVPSDAGPVLHESYVGFLKDFRRIIEGKGSVDEQLARLDELPERGPLYRSYWESLRVKVPGFPASVFVRDVLRIDGVGWTLARRLVKRGLNLAHRVLRASDSELLSVPGLGRRVLAAIRRHGTPRD